MKFFRNNKQIDINDHESLGGFYVEQDRCLHCGAPEAEAPDLVGDHPERGCYFKKQPSTPGELSMAIDAMESSCISCIRYGGKNEAILKYLHKLGFSEECDHHPAANNKPVVRNSVRFLYRGTIHQLSHDITSGLLAQADYKGHEITGLKIDSSGSFEFSYYWSGPPPGIAVSGNYNQDGNCTIALSVIGSAHPVALKSISKNLHATLKMNEYVQCITWEGINQDDGEYFSLPHW